MEYRIEKDTMGEMKVPADKYWAAQTERSVVENIRAKGARPKENGAAPKPAVTIKKNVDELTNADIDEIMRRVQRGETISF